MCVSRAKEKKTEEQIVKRTLHRLILLQYNYCYFYIFHENESQKMKRNPPKKHSAVKNNIWRGGGESLDPSLKQSTDSFTEKNLKKRNKEEFCLPSNSLSSLRCEAHRWILPSDRKHKMFLHAVRHSPKLLLFTLADSISVCWTSSNMLRISAQSLHLELRVLFSGSLVVVFYPQRLQEVVQAF